MPVPDGSETPPAAPVVLYGGHPWLSLGVFLLSLALLLDAGARAVEVWRGREVYLVPPGGPSLARPGVIPQVTATKYAKEWYQNRNTFTPETIDAVHTAIKETLHPRIGIAFGVQAKDEAKEIKRHKMASQATAIKATILQYADARVIVQVDGLQTVMIGQEQVSQDPLTLVLTLEPWAAAGVPSGLLVTRIQEPSLLKSLKR